MTVSVVQVASSNTTTVTFGSNTTPGNAVIVCVCSFAGGTASISGMTLGGSADNFAQLPGATVQEFNASVFIWADFDCTQAATAVVVTGSNLAVDASDGGIAAFEVSGLAGTLDKVSAAGTTGSANWSSGTTATTSSADQIWLGCVDTANDISTEPGLWTNTAFRFAAAGYLVVSSTGTATYNGTQASAGDAAAAVVTLPGKAAPASLLWFGPFTPWTG